MLTMKDIIREGHPTLRKRALEVEFPLSDEDKQLGHDMMEFLINSQDPELAEKYGLRSGVGLAAPQLNESKRMLAVLIPSIDPEAEDDISFAGVLYNPRITRQAVHKAALADGEGCLSVDRDVPGYVARPEKITLEWYDEEGNLHTKRFRDYEAIVLQHELDHLDGILFFDHINKTDPLKTDPDVKIIG